MNRIDEEEEDDDDNTDTLAIASPVDRFPSVQLSSECTSNSIYPNKQTSNKNDRSKYQTTNRPTSLSPGRHFPSSNDNLIRDVKQRKRYASDSNTNNIKNIPTSLVTSFLRHLRHELRATTTNNKNDYHRPTRQKSTERIDSLSTNTSETTIMNGNLSNENLSESNNDNNEILTLIDLLVLRVECLSNEKRLNTKKRRKEHCPTVAEVDQNLIEYLYYLFTKFINDESNSSNDLTAPIIDKNSFVNVCQILVRNGCFDIPNTNESSSSDQSASDTTSSSDSTLTQKTSVHEYHPDRDKISGEKSSTDEEIHSTASTEQDTWLIVDLEGIQSEEEMTNSEITCQLPTSISDEQLLITNDNYNSFESESSPSVYLSPNSSLIDLQNMVQEVDEINNPFNVSFDEDGSSSNVILESKTTISNDLLNDNIQSNDNICTRLTNVDSSIENSEEITTNNTDKMSRREKKMQERWSISTKPDKSKNEQSSLKTLLTVEFPPIAVLRRKFSSSPTNKKDKNNSDTNPDDKLDSNLPTTVEEINTSPTAIIVNKTNPDQIVELPSADVQPLISTDLGKINDDKQLPVTISEVICLSDEEIIMRKKQGPSISTSTEYQIETITNINNDLVDNQPNNVENSSEIITNPSDSNLMPSFPSSSSLVSISSPPSLMLTTDENKTIEPLSKEKGEEKIEEEQQRCNDDYNVDEEKKNTSSFVHDYHASGIILINDEPTQTALLYQEKKEKEEEEERERPSSLLPTLEQFNQQRTEDESPVQTLSNDLNTTAMTNIDENEERYKKVEIEEISDDEDGISTQSVDSSEPTDYIHTDDEPKKSKQSSSQSNVTTTTTSSTTDDSLKFDNVFSCYEKALAKVVDTYHETSEPLTTLAKESIITSQQPANDPIALRALQRFEERMNAAAAAKTTKDETNTLAAKGKSPWSTSLSTSRKSLDNILKEEEQQLRPTPISFNDESKTVPSSSSLSDSYIRPRKTFDDNSLNYGTSLNLFGITSSTLDKTNNDDYKLEKQPEPSTLVDNVSQRVVDSKSMMNIDSTEQQENMDDTINANENDLVNEEENFQRVSPIPTDNARMSNSFDTVASHSSSTEQQIFTPYRFQLEGRRRLNGVERMRDRHQSRESLDTTDYHQQIQNDYTLKPEEVQDPIIRRALERFDEKNRTLTQTKSMNYDEVQDPITRRALMRLESNLKRTIPSTTNDSNENWYTESYTLGSLQPSNDRLSRYNDSSQSPTLNNKPKYISVHQHYCTPSSDDTSHEHNIPDMRVPAQPIYVTSNNLQQPQPLSVRQRSRSEDMLSSRDLSIGQTTNLDDIDTSPQLQRNRSSNQIAAAESGFLLPNTLMKALEPNFVRTTESSVSYATPTQTYSAYSCEYTRPRRNVASTSSDISTTYKQESNQLPPPKYSQLNEIQRPTPYRPSMENEYQTQTSSAFAPIRSSTSTTTGGYYSQQPLPTPSYGSMYTSNTNNNQLAYSEDPIIRRALERFNSQMQNSLLSTSQYEPTNSYVTHQGNFHENYINSNRPTLMTTSTSSNSSIGGYQSIIGRRRQTRQDDLSNSFIDNTTIGDGYSSSLFGNSNNLYTTPNQFDEPPAIPPRFRRNDDINDQYRRHSIDEYHTENQNNNNNNSSNQTLPRDTFIHHAYPATITNSSGFRPINIHYNQSSLEQDDLHDPMQLPSNNNSSDNFKQQQRPIRPDNIRTQINNQERLPPPSISTRTNIQQNGRKTAEQITSNKTSQDNSQQLLDQTVQNNGNVPGDSVFHRLAYTGTKASLSKSSSNSCSNLLNKSPSQIPISQLKPCEIDFDDSSNTTSTTIENTDDNEQISTFVNKCQRSKSVDGRARLKLVQARTTSMNNPTNIDNDENDTSTNDEEQKPVPSSKFIPINGRRDIPPPPRTPLTPTITHRTSSLKRPSNGNNLTHTKDSYGFRTPNSNGNLLDSDNQQQDIENDENISYNDDNYQPKLVDNRIRTAIPVHRYTNNNNYIQPSPSTSSVTSIMSRTKIPNSTSINLDRRDSNTITDINRTPRRPDEHHRPSPTVQRRNVPVSVFSPAKLDNKRPAPAPPAFNYESQPQTSYSARLPTHDNSYTYKMNEHEINSRTSSTNSDRKTPTGNIVNEFTLTTDKHDNNNNKKMNVFERLFRGNKKKN